MASGHEALINRATAVALMQPDWEATMAISDAANQSPRSAQEIAGLLLAKLSQENPKVAHLAVGVADSLAKNGTAAVHVALAESGTAASLGSLARKHAGRPLGEAAATLLQELAVAYGSASEPPLNTFGRARRAATADGVRFPPAPEAGSSGGVQPLALRAGAAAGAAPHAGAGAGADLAPPSGAGAVSYPAEPPAQPGAASADAAQEALLGQLGTVQEWSAEAASLLQEGGGRPSGVRPAAQSRFLDLVDMLSQCQDRLIALIEAGLSGRLSDACLGASLEAQATLTELLPWIQGDAPPDREALARIAAAWRPRAGPGASAGAGAAGGAAAAPAPAAAAAGTTAGTATGTAAGDDDLLGLFDSDAPAPAAAAAPAPPPAAAAAPTTAAAAADSRKRAGAPPAEGSALGTSDSFDPRDEGGSHGAPTAAGGGAGSAGDEDDPFDPRGGDAPPPLATAASDSSFDPRGEPAAATAPAPAAADDVDAFEAYLAEQDAAT
ncbi:hypothetical protein FNF31_07931 [Cafeteria roenbergensis]|uniref:VHS domain-containing protein n=1 Tax=Cafeteria roenbergensis TaxID=33653 RepID=A0A5A8BZQ8_CAFRO|nr:hypothetical protein FNF31_07931 [Cafeteria roenbergensis]